MSFTDAVLPQPRAPRNPAGTDASPLAVARKCGYGAARYWVGHIMSEEAGASRRKFIAGAGVASVGAVVALQASGLVGGGGDGGGLVSIVAGTGAIRPNPMNSSVWYDAVDSYLQVAGENGSVLARIVSVDQGDMGGVRPGWLRAETLVVAMETDARAAPVGDRIYAIDGDIGGVRELFLTRGEDVMGKAVLLAVLN